MSSELTVEDAARVAAGVDCALRRVLGQVDPAAALASPTPAFEPALVIPLARSQAGR
jgi:MinD superfamily P-loop ATPase